MLLSGLHQIVDLVFRIKNKIRELSSRNQLNHCKSQVSDSENRYYVKIVNEIIRSINKFNRFRRIYDYREILEHVDYKLGESYLQKSKMNEPNILSHILDFKKNDTIGKPRKYKYQNVGFISPTTLRYISVATDLRRIFGTKKMGHIVEIGGGYGGQASILHKMNWFNHYSIYDLTEVQTLISRFLKFQNINNVRFPSIEKSKKVIYDLAISNYAFSELPKELQLMYMKKILLKSKNGYLIMNSGKSNISLRSDGKMSLEEIRAFIPNLEVLEEIPLTGPDNYVIVWKG